ncbi:MAG: phage major capsid protein [Mycobacterium sp.]
MSVTATSGSYTFNTEVTAKLREYLRTDPIEQTRKGNRFLDSLTRDKEMIHDANEVQFPVSFIEDSKGDFYDNWDPTGTGDSDDVTMAKDSMKSHAEPIKLSRRVRNRSSGRAIFKILAHKMKQAMIRSENKWAASFMSAATGGPNSLEVLLPNDGGNSSTALHGIRGDQNAGWQCNFQNIGGALSSNLDKLDDLSEDCKKYGLTDWDTIVTTKAILNDFKAYARTLSSIEQNATAPAGSRLAALGWTGVTWEGKPVIADRHCPTGKLFMYSTNSVVMAVDPMDDWVLEGPFPTQVNGQHGDQWFIYSTAQLVTLDRGSNGVAFGIS